MNQLKQILAFKLIVEEGNISRAAALLGITKAAASRQLIELENRMNAQLIVRTTRSHRLTDTGKVFYDSVKKIFVALQEAESIMDEINSQPSGLLKIASNRHFGEKYIINNLKDFISQYPDLKIDLELTDRFPDLERENIDILCGIEADGPDHYVRRKIFSAFHVFCASPDYLKQFGLPKKPEDLKNHRYITHACRDDNILTFPDDREIMLDFHLRFSDAKTMLDSALQGMGIIKIFSYHVNEAIKEGKLVEILTSYRQPAKPIYIYYQTHKFLQKKIRFFLDFLYSKIRS